MDGVFWSKWGCDVNLCEALNVVRTARPGEFSAELRAAQTLVVHTIQELSKGELNTIAPEMCEDVAQDVAFIILKPSGPMVFEYGEKSARKYLKEAIRNKYIDYYRKDKTYAEGVTEFHEHQKVHGGTDVETASEEERTREKFAKFVSRSSIFQDYTSDWDVEEVLVEALRGVVLERMRLRADAHENTRVAIDQLCALRDGKASFDQLVDEQAGPDATESERKRARDSIQKRHQRTRDRLLAWLEKAQQSAPTTPTGDGAQLTQHDIRALCYMVSNLRSRAASDTSKPTVSP